MRDSIERELARTSILVIVAVSFGAVSANERASKTNGEHGSFCGRVQLKVPYWGTFVVRIN